MKNIQRLWDVQTAGGKPIRKSWLKNTSTGNLLDLLELGAVIEADRQMDGNERTNAPRYVSESIDRLRAEIKKRAGEAC